MLEVNELTQGRSVSAGTGLQPFRLLKALNDIEINNRKTERTECNTFLEKNALLPKVQIVLEPSADDQKQEAQRINGKRAPLAPFKKELAGVLGNLGPGTTTGEYKETALALAALFEQARRTSPRADNDLCDIANCILLKNSDLQISVDWHTLNGDLSGVRRLSIRNDDQTLAVVTYKSPAVE
jgi:hypothetical protein